MVETMYAKNGAGLAAIQVGSPLRIFIVEASITGGDENDHTGGVHQPDHRVALRTTPKMPTRACTLVPRHLRADQALAARPRSAPPCLDGQEFVAEGEGLYARAMQHEQ